MRVYLSKRQAEMVQDAIKQVYESNDKDALYIIDTIDDCIKLQKGKKDGREENVLKQDSKL